MNVSIKRTKCLDPVMLCVCTFPLKSVCMSVQGVMHVFSVLIDGQLGFLILDAMQTGQEMGFMRLPVGMVVMPLMSRSLIRLKDGCPGC